MGANKYENFSIEVVDRDQIHFADYNPRKITDNAFKKLKKWFNTEGKGQLAPIIINKNTMTVVSGHQRLKCLDQLHRGKPYKLTVSVTDLDEKTEVEANVFMNNASAQGDFDFELLSDLHDLFPDISFTDGFGFDEADVSLMFNTDEDIRAVMGDGIEADTVRDEAKKFSTEDFRTSRKKELEKIREGNNTDGSTCLEKDDFTFTVVCISNSEKHELMRLMHERETEKFIKSNKLYDIYDHKIKLRELS